MTQKNLMDCINDAIHQIDTYKHPNTDEFAERVEHIIRALGIRGTLTDGIAYIGWYDPRKELHIRTEYSVRGCSMSDDIEIPTHILEAPDPVAAAKALCYERKLRKAKAQVAAAEHDLVQAKIKLDELLCQIPI